MAKRKPADDAGVDENEPLAGTEMPNADVTRDQSAAGAADGTKRSKWAPRFDSSSDNLAGVHLIEDRENDRMLIKFDEKPSEEVRALLKSQEHRYQFDGEEQVWWKKINPAKPRQCRREAQDLAFEAANMIRKEKGIELNEPFSPAM